jgi:restriction system protein
MDEIAPRRIAEFLRIIFIRLWQERAGLPVAEILMYIPEAVSLTDYEVSDHPATHTPRYERAIRLATTPYVKAGWLEKDKGCWLLTEEGKQACKSYATAEAFYQEAGRLFSEWRQGRSDLALVTEQAEEMAWEQMRHFLQEMHSYEFQTLVGDLLTAMGYHLAWVAPAEKERGLVNIIIYVDPLGLSIPRIKVHILHTGQPVLQEGLKAFMSVLGPEDAGIFISLGGFTAAVTEEAQVLGPAKISLVDLAAFFNLWVENYDKLTDAARQRFPLQPIHFLNLADQ